MKTKLFLTVIGLVGGTLFFHAQFLKKLERKVEQKVNQRIDRNTDRAIDKGLNKVEGTVKETAKKSTAGRSSGKNGSGSSASTGTSASSGFDFVPGSRTIFFDDFLKYPAGDFPSGWNTNGSGEIVTLRGKGGKWLKVPDNTSVFPEIKGALPQDFTIEFDLLYPDSGQRPPVTFGFSEVLNPAKNSLQHKGIFYFIIPPSVKQFVGYSTSLYSGRETTTEWPVDRQANKNIRTGIAVNGTRVRLYMDGEKIFDLPKGFDRNSYRNNFHFRAAPLIPKPTDGFYISNLRIAEVK